MTAVGLGLALGLEQFLCLRLLQYYTIWFDSCGCGRNDTKDLPPCVTPLY